MSSGWKRRLRSDPPHRLLADPAPLVHALNMVGSMEMLTGVPGGRDKLYRSLDLAKEAGLEEPIGLAYVNFADAALLTRCYDSFDAWLTNAHRAQEV